jgi:hypothetical protein
MWLFLCGRCLQPREFSCLNVMGYHPYTSRRSPHHLLFEAIVSHSHSELSCLTQPTHIYPSLTLTQWSNTRQMRAVILSCLPLSPWILPKPSLIASCQSVTADYPWDIFADLSRASPASSTGALFTSCHPSKSDRHVSFLSAYNILWPSRPSHPPPTCLEN